MFQILIKIAEAAATGLFGALCMTVFETPFWRKWGMEGVAEWQVNAAMVSIIYGKMRMSQKKLQTQLAVAMHLIHGIILGIIFLPLPLYVLRSNELFWVMGTAIIYSVLLWVITPLATRRVFESKGHFRMTSLGLSISFGSHIIYGLVLGLLVVQLV